MKNILFYTVFDVSPQKGGTERITDTISCYLQNCSDYNCYLSYSKDISPCFQKSTCFSERIKISENDDSSECTTFIKCNQINFIIVQGAYTIIPFFREIISQNNLTTKILFVHHFNPGAEIHFNNFMTKWLGVRKGKTVLAKIKALLSVVKLPYTKLYYNYYVRYCYRRAYFMSDGVVLLSKRFIPNWKTIANISDNKKFYVIHNSLTFNTFLEYSEMQYKKKEVLIVARLSEYQKRIKTALIIWKKILENPISIGWNLKIVGSGPWLDDYKEFVLKRQIANVSFEGMKTNVIDYYREASIFFMTSSFEGWGLTLTESQQMGVVPVVFNTYESLADIVISGYNGYSIPDNDVESFKNCVLSLMKDEQKRRELAINCITSSKRFSIEFIGNSWIQLMDKLA